MSIMKCASAFIVATTLLWAASPGFAHHSPSNYDLGQVIEIEGEITRVLWRNPHVRIWIMPVGETDEEAVWEVQATPVVHLTRRGISRDLINVGDSVRVAGSPARRSINEMLPHNILLPGDREFVLDVDGEPRWSENIIRPAREPEPASDTSLGIFRVWLGQGGFEDESFALTDSARAVSEEMATQAWDAVLDGCTPKGMPEIMAQPNPMEFVDQGDTILIRLEEYDTVRVVSMSPDAGGQDSTPTLLGHSVGEWQDKMLVVTTTGIDYPWFLQRGIPQSEAMEVVERFTVNDEGSLLTLDMTITDPATFVEPALLTKTWTWRPGLEVLLFECAEE